MPTAEDEEPSVGQRGGDEQELGHRRPSSSSWIHGVWSISSSAGADDLDRRPPGARSATSTSTDTSSNADVNRSRPSAAGPRRGRAARSTGVRSCFDASTNSGIGASRARSRTPPSTRLSSTTGSVASATSRSTAAGSWATGSRYASDQRARRFCSDRSRVVEVHLARPRSPRPGPACPRSHLGQLLDGRIRDRRSPVDPRRRRPPPGWAGRRYQRPSSAVTRRRRGRHRSVTDSDVGESSLANRSLRHAGRRRPGRSDRRRRAASASADLTRRQRCGVVGRR